MPLAVDETAGDLPVRDVGSRGGLIPALLATDSTRDVRSWRKPQVLKIKDRRHTFHIPREQLEDQCFRLQEESTLLKQHSRAQELKMRRMSTKLMRLQRGRPGTAGARERELDETIQELEARVATLESQKGMLQSKLNLARQHIMDLGGRSHYRPKGRGPGGGGEVRRAAQTAPPRCELSYQEDTHGEIERPSSGTDTQQVRMAELELATHFLRDTLRERDREFEDAMRELRKQQAEGHRMAIKENVDAIRLQKQLSEKGTALLVMQEKFNVLQEVRVERNVVCDRIAENFLSKETYEAQLEESQKSLKESQQVLLHKVEELTEQLKQERLKALTLEGQLTTATLSLQASEELQERVADLEGERDLLKESYDRLLHSTMSTQDEQNKPDRHLEKQSGGHQKKEQMEGDGWSVEQRRLQEQLRAEQEEKERLENERERMRWEKERIMEEQQRDREMSEKLQEKIWSLEQEVLCYQKEVASLQGRLDSVTKEFDMSVEDLSDTLLQIKAFRLKREEQEKLHFPGADGTSEEQFRELASLRASHAETVLELQKTREMLLLQSRINSDFQSELRSLTEKAEKEREENKKRMMEKDKLLERRAQRITTLQAQLKDLAYSPKSYKRTIPIQYTWSGDIQEAAESTEYDTTFGQLQAGESLLEIHLRGASFTPVGLRTMKYGLQDSKHEGVGQEVVTFCTYSLLDFEMHATPLISGPQANYGFTSRYPLSPRDIERLIGRGGGVRVELHQSLGGVKFTTCGITWIPLSGAVAKRGERVTGRANITGRDEEVVGVLEFWVRLYQPVEPAERQGDRWTNTLPGMRATLTWQDSAKEMFDFGGGIPNELEVLMERCVGLRARWPGLLPDAYLLYRLYDLPPHATATIHCSSDPVFNDSASYPLAVTRDVLAYLQEGSLWVYVFDDSDDRTPPSYLAKSPIPLRALAMGRHIRGDFVLRDTGGSPRGMVRVSLRWRYPFQAPEALQRLTDVGRDERQMERRTEKSRTLQRPIAKPRSKVALPTLEVDAVHREIQRKPMPPKLRLRRSKQATSTKSHGQDRGSPTLPSSEQDAPSLFTPKRDHSTPFQSPARKRATPLKSSVSDQSTPFISSMAVKAASLPPSPGSRKNALTGSKHEEGVSLEEELQAKEEAQEPWRNRLDSDVMESSESRASSGSDVVIIPQPRQSISKGNRLRVEILSLSFHPTSRVALDQSVQRVYVEYRLLDVPMETTETPMSLRKPTAGEEIHYNFTRVIYVDGAEAAPLRQYLYTMLEGTDPNQGRLKFTVVSEPMDEQEEECVDVGYAYLDLRELLLTGTDVIERDIDIVSVGDGVNVEVVGKLKVTLEAAHTLTGIYWEFQSQRDREAEEDREEGEEEGGMQEEDVEPVRADNNSDDDYRDF